MIEEILNAIVAHGIPRRNAEQLRRKLRQHHNGCIEYFGAHAANGDSLYSITKDGITKHYKLHRLVAGVTDRQLLLLPRCGANGCINPEHREPMTRAAFNARFVHRSNKLDWPQVRRVRSTPEVDCAIFAREYGVSRDTIWRVRNNLTWRE